MTSCNSIARTARLLLVVLLCLCASQAYASTAATVLFSHGSVHAAGASGEQHALTKGDAVRSGDTIITGTDGRIQMRFSDGGLVSLMPGSKFVVEQYQQPTDESDGSLVFNLVEGGLRTLTGSIGHRDHDDYKLKTSVATLGIRGTQFVVVMDGDVMRIHVGHGKVFIYNKSGELLLVGGENGIVIPGKQPEKTDEAPDYLSSARTVMNVLRNSGGSAGGRNIALAQDVPLTFIGDVTEGYKPANPGFAVAYRPAGGAPPMAASYNKQEWQQALDAAGGALPSSVPGFLPAKPDTPLADIQPNPPTVNKTGSLVWGEVLASSNQSGTWSYYQPYVWGVPTPAANIPATGTLSYSLADATAARYTVNGASSYSGTLQKFDLDIHLNGMNAPSFAADMEIKGGNTTWYPSTPSPVTGSMNGASFKFAASISHGGCPNCVLDVSGLLSGAHAEQAGVVYKLFMDGYNPFTGVDSGKDRVFTGAAVMHK